MTPPEHATVAVELERLHGTMSTGFAEVKGSSLGVLVERSNRTEEDVRKLRADTEEETKAIRTDMEGLKRTVWSGAGGAIVLATLAGFLVQYFTS